ncbi:hypothetical protein [Paraflavitalea sp. CAU 1676]|uniref:hypothetical protein n=1 Tax=Paraflavitalea sp. CAU 1676 TaxID=3032598 RepID=UPI0023DB4076|nr:hypothetical protein [Paraflavitalea sp. CAU 1676]MDF2191090.1 hypothetical protein [Paraflavitalea sp. CAU 1676]
MKRSFLLLLVVTLLGTITTQAQLKLPKATSPVNVGNLLTQFTDGLKPTSFLDSWTGGGKTDWLSAAAKVTDGAGLGKSISSLAGFIKPSLFKGGFNVASLVKTANTVKTLSSAAGLLKNLEGGLKPEAFTSAWSGQRSGWLNALNLLK